MLPEQLAQLRREPAVVAGLDRETGPALEGADRALEAVEIDLQARRELEQDRPEPVTEDRGPLHQVVDRPLRLLEAADVAEVPTRLDREPKVVRHRVAPPLEGVGRRHPIERDVQLDRLEVLGVVREPVAGLEEPRIERPAPVAIVEPGRADEQGHRRERARA